MQALATKFAADALIAEVDAAAVASAAAALEPSCSALIEQVTQAAADLVTSPPRSSAIPLTHAYWLSATAALITYAP